MSRTTVTLTGTGVPAVQAGTAGAGVLIQHDGLRLQLDAGRATTLRLAEAGVLPHELTAVLLSHHRSDHLFGLADLVLSRWLHRDLPALPIVAPRGPCTEFVEHLLDPWELDIATRMAHTGRLDRPGVEVHGYDAGADPVFVWVAPDVVVSAVAVQHGPFSPAAAYRVDTPDGAIVVSGDTRASDEVRNLARGARVLVHEACRTGHLRSSLPGGAEPDHGVGDHADSVALGTLAEQAGVEVLVLTHLNPPVTGPADRAAFEADVRSGGFEGEVVVGRDLTTVDVWRHGPVPGSGRGQRGATRAGDAAPAGCATRRPPP